MRGTLAKRLFLYVLVASIILSVIVILLDMVYERTILQIIMLLTVLVITIIVIISISHHKHKTKRKKVYSKQNVIDKELNDEWDEEPKIIFD